MAATMRPHGSRSQAPKALEREKEQARKALEQLRDAVARAAAESNLSFSKKVKNPS